MQKQKLDNASYESVADFVDACDELVNTGNRGEFDKFDNRPDPSFYGAGCNTGKDVRKLVANGWKEGQDNVTAMLEKTSAIEAALQDRRRKRTRGEFGDDLDIHAVYRGHLDVAWSRTVRRNVSGPQKIDILANMICSGGASSTVLQWRGAAAVALADKLERSGYMVRIVVGFGGEAFGAGNPKVSCRITVKPYDRPLDVSTCAAVTLPGFFRALGHRWIYGHAAPVISAGGITVRESKIEAGEIVATHSVRDEPSALKWIDEQIAKINGEDTANAA